MKVFRYFKNCIAGPVNAFHCEEPFKQARGVAALASYAKKLSLTAVIFTGLTYKKLLLTQNSDYKDALSVADLLIIGSFNKNNFDLSL